MASDPKTQVKWCTCTEANPAGVMWRVINGRVTKKIVAQHLHADDAVLWMVTDKRTAPIKYHVVLIPPGAGQVSYSREPPMYSGDSVFEAAQAVEVVWRLVRE